MPSRSRPNRRVQISSAAVILAGAYISLLAGSSSFSMVGGPDVTLRSVGLAVTAILCFLWRATAASQLRVRSAAPYLALTNLVFIYLIISSLWSPAGFQSVEKVTSIGIMALLINLAAWVISRSPVRILDQLWIVIFATSLAFFLGALASGPGLQGRYSAFGGGPNVFVRIMLLGMIASFAIYLIFHVRWILFGVPVFLIGALLSGSRGGLVALGVILIALVPLVRRLRWAGTVRIGLIMLFSGTTALALTPIRIRQVLYERFVVLSLQQEYDSGRAVYYSAAIELFKQRPVYGWGLGGYTDRTGLHYAHNLFLGFAAEGGLIGVCILITSLVASVAAIVLCRSQIPTSALMGLLASLCILVASLFSGDYYDSRYLWFFLIYAVYASRLAEPSEITQTTRETRMRHM